MQFPDARVLVFAKAPLPGQAKTRLIPALGAEGAAALATSLLCDTLARLAPTGLAPIELWCTPDDRAPVFQSLTTLHGLASRVQRGEDLGARLLHASVDALRRGCAVVLIGCDCPDLDADYLATALAGLADHDAVLGPATDGGYVLLGLRVCAPALFAGLPWGTGEVAALTRERMQGLGWRWLELPTLRDIDRPEDLAAFGLG